MKKVWIVEDLTDNSIRAVCDSALNALNIAILAELHDCGICELTYTIIQELFESYNENPESFGSEEAWGIYTTEINSLI